MSKSILIADDEMALRFLVSETLADEGYEITEVDDGGKAIQCLEQEVLYDLLILDYMMPEKTGIEVCAYARTLPAYASIPIVLLTAKATEKDRERAEEAGITAYVIKPFSPLQLIDTIEQLLEG